MISDFYHASDFRKKLGKAKKRIAGLFETCVYSPVEWADIGEVIHTVPDKEDTSGAFEVVLFRQHMACEGKNGNLFSGRHLIKGATDGLGRQRSSNYSVHWKISKQLDFALSLHTAYPNNYYHFVVQTLPKVIYAEQALKDDSFPILVPEKMAETGFFKGAVALGFFGKHPLITQKRSENVHLKEIALVRASRRPISHVYPVLERLGCVKHPKGERRIYIQRSSASPNSRTIRNISEVAKLLKHYDFELVDPMTLSLAGQIETFAQASHIVSPHGAGLTNILYRYGSRLSVLEVFNKNLRIHCYREICRELNFAYDSMLAENEVGKTTSGSSEININELRTRVKYMLSNENSMPAAH